jgi:hypothetical protein
LGAADRQIAPADEHEHDVGFSGEVCDVLGDDRSALRASKREVDEGGQLP